MFSVSLYLRLALTPSPRRVRAPVPAEQALALLELLAELPLLPGLLLGLLGRPGRLDARAALQHQRARRRQRLRERVVQAAQALAAVEAVMKRKYVFSIGTKPYPRLSAL